MNIKNNFRKVIYYFKRYGIIETIKKIFKKILHIKEIRRTNQEQYEIWMKNNLPIAKDFEFQENIKFQYEPKISIVVPMYNTNEIFLKELIQSLQTQTYSNWELLLADGSENYNENLKQYYENDERIKYKFLDCNKGISENTNEAIKQSTGEFIAFLDHDDLLPKDALYEIVKIINENNEVDFIYTDEDKIDEDGERFEPYFKPNYSPETLECNNYITHFVIVKRELLNEVGLLETKFNGAQDFDFILRATEKAKQIIHIPKILYHWRAHRNSTADTADAKTYAYEIGLEVIKEHLERTKKAGKVEYGQDVPGIYKIKYDVIGSPKVSILIPNKDHIDLLKNCINSIVKLTTYENYEIVIIENNSEKQETFEYYKKIVKNDKIKVLNYNKNTLLTNLGQKEVLNKINLVDENEFNYSSLINFGVKNVDGEYILQLNNDTKLLTKDWLELFIGYGQNKEIGACRSKTIF